MKQKDFRCDYYTKKESGLLKRTRSTKIMKVKVTDIERDSNGNVTISVTHAK